VVGQYKVVMCWRAILVVRGVRMGDVASPIIRARTSAVSVLVPTFQKSGLGY